MKKLLICGVALGFLFALGCGGSDDDSGPSASTKASELTEQEAEDLCNEWADEMDAAIDAQHFGCIFGAAMASGGDSTMCQTVYDTCMAEDYTPEPNDCDDAYADTTDCPDVTIGEMEACQDAMMAQFKDATDGVTCQSDETALNGLGTAMGTVPQACQDVQEKCPSMFEE